MDMCTCPGCGEELEVEEYGRGLRCSECGCRIDVFRDEDLLIDTPFGFFRVSLPVKNG